MAQPVQEEIEAHLDAGVVSHTHHSKAGHVSHPAGEKDEKQLRIGVGKGEDVRRKGDEVEEKSSSRNAIKRRRTRLGMLTDPEQAHDESNYSILNQRRNV